MKTLSAREEEIMGFFWEKGPLFVKEIVGLYDEPRPHFNTLSTFVRALEEKGYLSHRTFGNTYQYYAVVSHDEFKKKTLKSLLKMMQVRLVIIHILAVMIWTVNAEMGGIIRLKPTATA